MTGVAEHLESLVRIPSVSKLSNRPVIDYAMDVLRRAEWQTRELSYSDAAGVEKINLIAAPPGQSPGEVTADLAFFCHSDTVPYAPEWDSATSPVVHDGFLHGCGAADVKGFLACLLAAASEVPPGSVAAEVRLVLTADEEIGCIGAQRLIEAGVLRPKRAVIGEPTSLHPARAGKGYFLAEVTVFGQEAHSALPHEGASAIYRAARFIMAIEAFAAELAKVRHAFFNPPFTTVNIGTIQGGTAKNIIPGQCCFQLEWRPIPGQSENNVPDAVSTIAESLQRADPGFRWNMNLVRKQVGFETSGGAPLVQHIQALTGREAVSIPFASEASLLATVAEEVVVFGPGDMRSAHSSRERVPLGELDAAVGIIKQLMSRGTNSKVPAVLAGTSPRLLHPFAREYDQLRRE